MRGKEIKPSAYQNIDQNLELAEEQKELPEIENRTILRFRTREEKMQEASKSLYLKRYE